MMTLTTEQLDKLTREELLELLKQLLPLVAEVERLRQRVEELETENERLKNRSANSRNSSQPPSRDHKVNRPPKKKRKKHGPPFGHQKFSRPLVDNPDRVIQLPVTECEHCLADLTGVAPEDFERRQITELPTAKPIVIETRQHRTTCPHCLTLNHATLPEGLEGERYFGPNLEATVVFYKQTQHLSYERIVETMRDLHGVILSEGAVAQIIERAGQKAAPAAETIKEQIIKNQVIKSDETSARVEGRNWWQWVFIGDSGVYHTIVPTRSASEIATVMGQLCVEAWVCDCYGAQLKAPARVFQLCLAHQLRDLQRVLDANPRERWASATQKLFRSAIHLRNRFNDKRSAMTLLGFQRMVTQIENQLDQLLEKAVRSEAARKLRNRFTTHRDKLLTFLHYPEVPPTNNESERALRGSVVHRKVTNGFRSKWGAQAYAAIETIIATAKHKGEEVFQALVNLMGAPVLPFLEGSSP
jgi:transposase